MGTPAFIGDFGTRHFRGKHSRETQGDSGLGTVGHSKRDSGIGQSREVLGLGTSGVRETLSAILGVGQGDSGVGHSGVSELGRLGTPGRPTWGWALPVWI